MTLGKQNYRDDGLLRHLCGINSQVLTQQVNTCNSTLMVGRDKKRLQPFQDLVPWKSYNSGQVLKYTKSS